MYKNILLLIFLIAATFIYFVESKHVGMNDDRSSLVFVFDTTGSMHDDLEQLREGAEMILDTALEHRDVISNFVFVPFNDPVVGPPTVTQDKEVFKSALNVIRIRGGGDCPEKSLGGILMALKVSLPRSYIYVLTDATAGDHRILPEVLDAVQRKQSQMVEAKSKMAESRTILLAETDCFRYNELIEKQLGLINEVSLLLQNKN